MKPMMPKKSSLSSQLSLDEDGSVVSHQSNGSIKNTQKKSTNIIRPRDHEEEGQGQGQGQGEEELKARREETTNLLEDILANIPKGDSKHYHDYLSEYLPPQPHPSLSKSLSQSQGIPGNGSKKIKSFIKQQKIMKNLIERALDYGFIQSTNDTKAIKNIIFFMKSFLFHWYQMIMKKRQLEKKYSLYRQYKCMTSLQNIFMKWMKLTPKIAYRFITWMHNRYQYEHISLKHFLELQGISL
jgi:hypothetical protein